MAEQNLLTDAQKAEMANHFEEMEADYRDDDMSYANNEVVYEDDDVVVVADHSGHELNEWAKDLDLDRSELSSYMHELAKQKCGYDWSASDPVVFDRVTDEK